MDVSKSFGWKAGRVIGNVSSKFKVSKKVNKNIGKESKNLLSRGSGGIAKKLVSGYRGKR